MTTTRKKERKTSKTCPECGGKMRWETRDDSVEYKGHRKAFSTTAWWCESCDEAIIDGPALQIAERAFVELRAEVDQILLPEEVSEVRKKLNISQREAGRILGGGPRAFQKYESGQVPVSEPMKNLLVLLRNDPRRLKELRRAGDRSTSKTIRRTSQRPRRSGPSARASRS